MARLTTHLILGYIYPLLLTQSFAAVVPVPQTSIEQFFSSFISDTSNQTTTVGPSLSERIQQIPERLQSIPIRIHDRVHSTIGNYITLPNLTRIDTSNQTTSLSERIQQIPERLQSLPVRIHDRVHSTIGSYITLPNLTRIGQPPPRLMLVEPPWVAEVLGPTEAPPTTPTPTFSEIIRNTIRNVFLFVPASIHNFWHDRWGTQHVSDVVQKLQVSTVKPPTPAIVLLPENGTVPVFNPAGIVDGNDTKLYAAILALVHANANINKTLLPTVEYNLRSENETNFLWNEHYFNGSYYGNVVIEDL